MSLILNTSVTLLVSTKLGPKAHAALETAKQLPAAQHVSDQHCLITVFSFEAAQLMSSYSVHVDQLGLWLFLLIVYQSRLSTLALSSSLKQ